MPPEPWPIHHLGGLAEVALSGVDKHTTPGEEPVSLCNYTDVYRNRRLTAALPFMSATARPGEVRRFTLRPGDLLITKDSEVPTDIGVPALVAEELDNTLCGYHLALIRTGPALLPSYLLHLLGSERAKRHFLARATGTTRFGLGLGDIAATPVPLPPPEEQAAIARVLDAVDAAIERNREVAKRALRLRTAALTRLLETGSFPVRRLGDYTMDVRYGTSQPANDRGAGHPVLRIPNVIGDDLAMDDLTHVELPPKEIARLALRSGDLLLVRTNGNPNYVGRSAVFQPPDRRTWVYASYLIRVRLVGLEPAYVNTYLGLETGRRELLRRVTTSAGNHNVNSNSIRLLQIPVPRDQADQVHIVRAAQILRRYCTALTRKARLLATLRASLMHDLLTGRVRTHALLDQDGVR